MKTVVETDLGVMWLAEERTVGEWQCIVVFKNRKAFIGFLPNKRLSALISN